MDRSFASRLNCCRLGKAFPGYILVILSLSLSLFASPETPRLVLLHSYNDGFTWTDKISTGVFAEFDKSGIDAELCIEHMDTRRLATDAYLDSYEQMLLNKYRDRPVDVIIAADDHAFTFIQNRGERLFPHVPYVFCSVSGYTDVMRVGRQMTGLYESIAIAPTLELALSLHPETKNVAVVTDMTQTGQALTAKAKSAFQPFTDRLSFEYLDTLSVETLDSTLANLHDSTIVFLFIFSKDKNGRVFSHEQNLQRIAPHCKRPIYGVWEFYLGHGIVGGVLSNGFQEGTMAARMALRILKGEKASDIDVQSSPVKAMFDFNELAAFNISPDQLPHDAIVVNKPFSFFETYSTIIYSTIAAFALLLILVFFLVVSIRRQHTTEKALRESREQQELAIIGADLGTWDWDIQTNTLRFNERFATMFGYYPSEIEPTREGWIKRIHPDDHDRVIAAMGDHIEGRAPKYQTEYRAKARNGSWRWVLDKGRVVAWDNHGKALRASGTHLDITKRKEAEEKRITVEEQLRHAQKLESLGILAGGIAHDFNNILTGILGHASLAGHELTPSSPARESLSQIEQASRRAADLCKQMLAYSGKGKFNVEPVNISLLVEDMGHLLSVSVPKSVAVRYSLADDLPAVEADSAQVGQVVMNLITNAADATQESGGSVVVTTSAIQATKEYLRETLTDGILAPGIYVALEVADTGVGMDAETRDKIFDPFFTTKFTGRGLGLSAVLGIVHGHKGAIRVYSEPGRGTTVKVLFPATAMDTGIATVSSTPVKKTHAKGSGTILLVDDDETARAAGKKILEHCGYDVLVARDGIEGLNIFSVDPHAVDCVLLDLMMPRMDGEETFRRMRDIDPTVRVLLSSGYNEQDATQHFSGKGLEGFVQKPYDVTILSSAIARLLDASDLE